MNIEDVFELDFIMVVVDFAAASANIWIKKTYRLVLHHNLGWFYLNEVLLQPICGYSSVTELKF
jgi:hypothetical protein